jgi:hypothetical protein
MCPFAALGTMRASHAVSPGLLAGFVVVVAFVAVHLAAWSAVAELAMRRRSS